jgi:hypothetical protein
MYRAGGQPPAQHFQYPRPQDHQIQQYQAQSPPPPFGQPYSPPPQRGGGAQGPPSPYGSPYAYQQGEDGEEEPVVYAMSPQAAAMIKQREQAIIAELLK